MNSLDQTEYSNKTRGIGYIQYRTDKFRFVSREPVMGLNHSFPISSFLRDL